MTEVLDLSQPEAPRAPRQNYRAELAEATESLRVADRRIEEQCRELVALRARVSFAERAIDLLGQLATKGD